MLYVDVTTTWQERGRHPHGTTRVERGIVTALARRADPSITFFRRDGSSFLTVPAQDVIAAATAPTQGDPGRNPQPDWWRHPLVLRARSLRRRLRAARPTAALQAPEVPPEDPFLPGSQLLFAGEHSRHDFGRLTAVKRAKSLRFAFLFYDLLHVLADDDPRLHDPMAYDLPQSDFIVREADCAVAISQFSANALNDHIVRRKSLLPPATPIRLAGDISPDPGQPVPGLTAGRFVLSVGDIVRRKNHELLVDVWKMLGSEAPPLVIAGRVDREGDDLVAGVKRDPLLRRSIHFLPDLADDALIWLYRNCRFTVFPSLLEGFGLPVAESLGYGKVCLASNAAAIPEAGEGAAIALDPRDADAWAASVRDLADDATLRDEERRIASLFRPVTWNDTAEEILEAIR
jgi:glycosyltransferase involved in cell wall biosynthesis